jgi:Flp pilus assembly pilin Flp
VTEYGLMLGSVAMLILLGGQAFGQSMFSWFTLLAAHITTNGT